MHLAGMMARVAPAVFACGIIRAMTSQGWLDGVRRWQELWRRYDSLHVCYVLHFLWNKTLSRDADYRINSQFMKPDFSLKYFMIRAEIFF